MEFFESQVGEVRNLVGAPAPPPPRNDSAREMSITSAVSPAASTPTNLAAGSATATGSLKRKGSHDQLDGASPPAKGAQRSKRNRYISIACNECKRRKIKCNGETPCQRCSRLNLQCLYAPNCCSNSFKDSDEYRDMTNQVSRLQEQVDSLFNTMSTLRSETLRLAPIQDRAEQSFSMPSAGSTPSSSSAVTAVHAPPARTELPPMRASFRGPTSAVFGLDVAKNTLSKMGYNNFADPNDDGTRTTREAPYSSPMADSTHLSQTSQVATDPLWEFDKDEILRLCRLHEEEIGIMYPIVKTETVIQFALGLIPWMEAARNHKHMPPYHQDNFTEHLPVLELKMLMANALVVEGHGYNERGNRLFESVRPTIDRIFMSDEADVKKVPLLCLVAGHRYLLNDENLAWRCIGQTARHCLELGLHRRDAIDRIENEDQRKNALHCFWSTYILDRRWAFSAGVPWVISDDEIDPRLPYPDSPYLHSLIDSSKLCAKVWRFVQQHDALGNFDGLNVVINDLDRKVQQWYTEVPKEAQLELPSWEAPPQYLNPPPNSQREYDIQRIQIWTWLRLSQVRIWLHTPILHTHSSIMENLPIAQRAVEIAKSVIKYLAHLNNTTNLYRKIQVFYHQFLTSAITVVFLASCHAPVNFSAECRDEFYMALELVKSLSSKSIVSKRLWATIKSLAEVAPSLGLSVEGQATDGRGGGMPAMSSASNSNVVGQIKSLMAGTTDAPPQAFSPSMGVSGSRGFHAAPADDSMADGVQLSNEMLRIFEGYMGTSTFAPAHPDAHPKGPPPAMGHGMMIPLGPDNGMYHR